MANYRNKSATGFTELIEKIFVQSRFAIWFSALIYFSLALFIGYLMAEKTFYGLGLTGAVVAMAIALVCMLNSEAGLYITLAYSFFISHFNRMLFNDSLPEGVFSDLLIGITFVGFLVRKVNLKQSINEFTKTPVVIVLLVLYCYLAIELFNPYAKSFSGWFPAFRKILGTLLLLFISFNVFVTIQKIKRFLKYLFIVCVITAAYGCIQQLVGFFDFEMNWLRSDPRRFRMAFIGGVSKKMSTMPDALSFAISMSTCSVLFISLASGQKKFLIRIVMGIGIIIMLLGMTFSLTRTANAMLIAGMFIFIIITFDRLSTRFLTFVSILAFLVLMYAPVQNSQLNSFRSTFEGKEDASFNVREQNRKSIQPYIYSHPIGGGLNTTGTEGLRYSPGHTLAGFPPDSGLLKKALEMGWIGLIMFGILYFLVLRTGIRGYFGCRNEENKLIYAGCTAACFSFYIGDFSQVAIGQITDIVIYYPLIAILLRLKNIDSLKT